LSPASTDGPVKVLVDSSCGVGAGLADLWGVGVVPMYVTWGGTTYREGVDLLPADFYRGLVQGDQIPKTSAPNVADFARAYAQHAAQGFRHVVVVAPSTTLTGVAQNALLGAREVSAIGVSVIDSRQGAGSQALIAAHAARRARQGGTADEVVAAAEAATECAGVWLCMDTIRYLRRAGRISAAQAIAAEAMRMKPIVSFVDGALSVVDRPRTRSRATARLMAQLDGPAMGSRHLLAMYSDDPGDGDELARLLKLRFPADDVIIDTCAISAVVGGSSGSGTRGVAAMWA
jgi:DegV family protein with EDD domain